MRSVGEDPDPRFTLANERTFLAWMTTGLGMLGAGLAVGTIGNQTPSEVIAYLWVAMAAIVVLRSMFRWFVLERAMRTGRGLPLSRSVPVVAISIAVLSIASVIVLNGEP